MSNKLLEKIDNYYSEKISLHGATSKGVDWNGKESHFLRFNELSRVLPKESNFSLLDYGCGFGSLLEYLNNLEVSCDYTGFDISDEMIKKAKEYYSSDNNRFLTSLDAEIKYDYTIANGIFNVKLDTSDKEWKAYIIDTILKINEFSIKGFSFNILTSYSDLEYRNADPLFYFDFCKKNISKNVALLHNYDLYEFTIIVNK